MTKNKHTHYHVQRVIKRAVERANDDLTLARNALSLLRIQLPEGLAGGWDANDLQQLELRLTGALAETGEFFHWLSC